MEVSFQKRRFKPNLIQIKIQKICIRVTLDCLLTTILSLLRWDWCSYIQLLPIKKEYSQRILVYNNQALAATETMVSKIINNRILLYTNSSLVADNHNIDILTIVAGRFSLRFCKHSINFMNVQLRLFHVLELKTIIQGHLKILFKDYGTKC
jgi:hypothetical protein